MSPDAALAAVKERLAAARAAGEPVRPTGGDTRHWFGRAVEATPLPLAGYAGIVEYTPAELVVTARCGTPLSHLESTLDASRQMLAAEPPVAGPESTLGGALGCGLSGPRRPYAGSLRDAVLGVRCLTVDGQDLRFGGRVMKNVAGFDLARLLVGACGTLALVLEASLKVLPRPERVVTLAWPVEEPAAALAEVNRLAVSLPLLAGLGWRGGLVIARIAGAASAVDQVIARTGRTPLQADPWPAMRDVVLPDLDPNLPLWRVVLPAAAPWLDLPGAQGVVLDWGGALRWCSSDAGPEAMRAVAARHGGHAMLFRGGDRRGAVMPPLPSPVADLHGRLKATFDPDGLLNPGRLYPDL